VEVPAGTYVLLAVSDSGVGIAPEVMPHIFEPFFTTKEKGKGTGLGLATVYGIVKQSGGYIWVYSERERGTTFKIYLPPGCGADRVASRSEAGPLRLQGEETLLLVEDEEAVRESAREYLAGCGYKVLTAGDGQEGVAVAEKYDGPIHLLITDVVMPRLSGSELAERVTAARPKLKVLYISGYTENTVVQHGVCDFGSLFLQKPFTLKTLAEKIRQVLDTESAPSGEPVEANSQ
jgi:CheY-like chemotaxis protein